MRRTAHNIILICCFTVIISVSIFTIGAKKAGFDLPDALEMDRSRSNLGGKQYAQFPSLSVSSLLDSTFQNSVNTFISDRFPRREDVLLSNAAWQRTLISISASAASYSVYPTFYGSDYCYDANRDQVVQTLDTVTADTDGQYASAVNTYNAFAKRNADKRFFFYKVDRQSSSSNNPTHNLVSNPIDTEYLDAHFFSKLGSDITVIDGTYPDADSLANAFYRTDHHWNGFAAYESAIQMLMTMNPDAETPHTQKERVYGDVPFFGSTSRSGLMLTRTADHLEDRPIDLDGITVYINGKERDSQILQQTDMYENGKQDGDLFRNRYAEYYHTDYALVDIRNSNAQTSKTLLIVGDSYSNSVERYFSSYYARVISYDARHNDEQLQDVLDETDADDVLFLMGSTNFPTETSLEKMG